MMPLMRTNPEKRKGADPGWKPISWNEVYNRLAARLQGLRSQGEPNKLLLLYGLCSRSAEDMVHRFAEAYGTPNVIPAEALEGEPRRFGRWMADGNYSDVAYDLASSNYVLAFGASLLEAETPLSVVLRDWGKMRRGKAARGKVVCIDPRYSITAAKSDEWIPIRPGTDAALALGIAHIIIRDGLYNADFLARYSSGFDNFKQMAVNDYNSAKVAEITGIDARTIERVAREFASTAPAIAWAGRGPAGWPNGSYSSYAIFCLNALVGSLDVPGGVIYPEPPQYRGMPGVAGDAVSESGRVKPRIDLGQTGKFPAGYVLVNKVADSLLSGEPYPIDTAIGFNVNLTMTAPNTPRWEEALARLPFYVHIGSFPGEMAQFADLLLPGTMYLEEWGYDHSLPGTLATETRLKQPVVEIHSDSRAIADIVFGIARSLGGNVAQSFEGIGGDARGFVKYRTDGLIEWDKFVAEGVWAGSTYKYGKQDQIFKTPSRRFEFTSGNYESFARVVGSGGIASMPHFEPPAFLGSEADYPLTLLVYHPVMNLAGGSQNYPWAQEIYLVMHGRGWQNFIEVNRQTAEKLGFRDGDLVWVESAFGKLKVTARVFQGMHPGVAAMALGQGHYAYGQWQKGIGVNPGDILGADYDRVSGGAAMLNTRVRIYRA